jgi:hypothetical protein
MFYTVNSKLLFTQQPTNSAASMQIQQLRNWHTIYLAKKFTGQAKLFHI